MGAVGEWLQVPQHVFLAARDVLHKANYAGLVFCLVAASRRAIGLERHVW